MAPRRWLLLVVSLASLLILAYGGVLIAYSVPVSAEMEAEGRLPGMESPPEAGRRALVLPVRDPGIVPTAMGGTGALLLVADDVPDFPASSRNASIVRALAFVTVDPDGRVAPENVTLANLTRREGDNATTYNQSFELGPMAGGRAGFLVKPDATDGARFVPLDQVVGTVEGYESLGDLVIIFLLGGSGFLLPLVYLVVTHRPSGRPGVGEVVCAECRGPMPAASDFCPRCGAWKKGRGA